MAIQWEWKNKIGEAIINQPFYPATEKDFTKTLYEGNCFLIFLNEWTEDGVDKYSLYSFFADERHAKICLGLAENGAGEKDNILNTEGAKLTKIRINKKKSRNYKKIVALFAQAFDNIEIEIYTEGDENND